MVNNSWMQVPLGYVAENGVFVPNDWTKIIFSSVVWSRFPHIRSASIATAIVFEIASEALALSERVNCSSIDNFKSASDWHLGKVSINLISRKSIR